MEMVARMVKHAMDNSDRGTFLRMVSGHEKNLVEGRHR